MSNTFTEVTKTGLVGNIKNAIVGALVGVLMFFGSFVLLYINEGLPNWGKIAKTAAVAPADKTDASLEGKFASVTAKIDSKEDLADPDYLKPGPWIELRRSVEMYAWTEKEHSETKKEVGGSSTTTTTYTYDKKWVSSVPKSSDFRDPKGHENPSLTIDSKTFRVAKATVGAWQLDANHKDLELPCDEKLALSADKVAFAAPGATAADAATAGTVNALAAAPAPAPKIDGEYVFQGTGSVNSPAVGDVRIGFKTFSRGSDVTLFGTVAASSFAPYVYQDSTFFRALRGTRDQAIAELKLEDAIRAWLLRLVGFGLMWFGMLAMTGPITAVADIIPIFGSAGRFFLAAVTFPIALVLTTVTVIVSMIAHSPIAIAIAAVVILGVSVVLIRSRKPKVAVAA